MAKIVPITEHFQHFLAEMKESFWGRFVWANEARLAAVFRAAMWERQRDRYSGWAPYERRQGQRRRYRNGLLSERFRDAIRDHSPAHRAHPGEKFSGGGVAAFSTAGRRSVAADPGGVFAGHFDATSGQGGGHDHRGNGECADGVEANPRSGRGGAPVHQARLSDDYVYLFVDGVSLRVRRPTGRKQVQMLVAYGIGQDGSRHLLAFLRGQGEGAADWEELLGDLYRRGLEGRALQLTLTDGCPGLAAAIRTVYPQAQHQRCWVHKMRNILAKARKCDYDEVKAGAPRGCRGRWRHRIQQLRGLSHGRTTDR